ncbi:MAG: hypothetical protein IJH75_06075 [Mogibacterium sp.]|nr:hypothetical protein [Mogibacterium sp.]
MTSLFADVWLRILWFIPDATNQFMGLCYSLLCQIIMAFSIIIYMKPGLGAGPRDTLMVILGNRFPNAPIGAARFGLEMCAMIIGILMGASFGLGTVAAIALQASLLQMACRICRFEPRDVVHEDIRDTLERMKS